MANNTGAGHDRGKSKQDYATPNDFMFAFKRRFGEICFDLAASKSNAQHRYYLSELEDSLSVSWDGLTEASRWLWLNPPFRGIRPWVKKCVEECAKGARIALLVPASVGSNWWAECVHRKAEVHLLSPRICFDGKNPYPKDMALCLYEGAGWGYECWRWKK